MPSSPSLAMVDPEITGGPPSPTPPQQGGAVEVSLNVSGEDRIVKVPRQLMLLQKKVNMSLLNS